MPISSLITLLSVISVLAVVRLALFKVFKPPVEQTVLPVETTTPQEIAETSEVTSWPVVVLLCVVVTAIVSLMMFGRVLAGG